MGHRILQDPKERWSSAAGCGGRLGLRLRPSGGSVGGGAVAATGELHGQHLLRHLPEERGPGDRLSDPCWKPWGMHQNWVFLINESSKIEEKKGVFRIVVS